MPGKRAKDNPESGAKEPIAPADMIVTL